MTPRAGRSSEPQILLAVGVVLLALGVPRFFTADGPQFDGTGLVLGLFGIAAVVGAILLTRAWRK